MTLATSLRPPAMLRDRDDGLMRWLLLGCGAFMLLALLLLVDCLLFTRCAGMHWKYHSLWRAHTKPPVQ